MHKIYRIPAHHTVFHAVLSTRTILYEESLKYLLVPKFFHNNKSSSGIDTFKFIIEIPPQKQFRYSENNIFRRKLCLYKPESSTKHTAFHRHLTDWPFSDKYSPKIGLSVRRFNF